MTTDVKSLKTLTGMSLGDALIELQKVLPKEAYKEAPGSGGFTDIDPHWARKIVTDVFGPQGIGWQFTYSPDAVIVTSQDKKSSSGRSYTLYTASIDYAEFRYGYVDEKGQIAWSNPVACNGGSDNEQRHWAVRGAITNAMNAGFAGLLWQLPVYLGIVSHKNSGTFGVGSVPPFEVKPAEKTTKAAAVPAAKAAAKPAADTAKAKPVSAGDGEIVEDTTPAPAPKAAADQGSYVIPSTVSKAWGGKSLTEIAGIKNGKEALLYFSRVSGNAEKDAVKKAVLVYLDAHPELKNGHAVPTAA